MPPLPPRERLLYLIAAAEGELDTRPRVECVEAETSREETHSRKWGIVLQTVKSQPDVSNAALRDSCVISVESFLQPVV